MLRKAFTRCSATVTMPKTGGAIWLPKRNTAETAARCGPHTPIERRTA